ncbi:chemotaxis protein CheX [Capsulimonas corticalis]|uniref:Chemotaxis protein CheX n=1 Tax=Capsulimonas corticalis TaxID=2219043 RepID=A0A402CU62_9BACT|nr:chemotaxis protein CheX [Capsulimonas corticalis]BDI28876.1 chemotaxis protein CheX [Capsulimonas corticalis]
MMKVEYINPFVEASFSVMEMVLGNRPVKGNLAMQPATFTSQQCNVVCGVTGQVQGQVIYGMSLQVADKIATTMLGQPIKVFDQLAASAIAELGNMISGNAMSKLSEAGFICDITPPTIIRGTNVKISTLSIPAIVIPITLEQGELSITVGLQGRK